MSGLCTALLGLALLSALPAAGAASDAAAGQTAGPSTAGSALLPTGGSPPPGAIREFTTDWGRRTIGYEEILSGGPPKDGIPALDRPHLQTVSQAAGWLSPREPVVLVQAGGEARLYPLQVLMWHEIVNDTVGGVALAVTFCPLCNTAIAFRREVAGRVLSFGTTGRLRHSNLLMYDRQTESWWQQATGEAVIGAYAGARLACLPAPILSWQAATQGFPRAKVLSRETGFPRPYGTNPYAGYDDVDSSPFLYRGPATPGPLRPMERVITVQIGQEAAAYPYELLRRSPAVNDTVGGSPVLVLWTAGVASALDASRLAEGRDVGSALAYSRRLEGRDLSFRAGPGGLHDLQTGSRWNLEGKAVSGPLRGGSLEAVVAINHFWFSWAAFRPDTRVYSAP